MTKPDWGDKAVLMARSGDSISKIRRELQVDWYEVWDYVRSVEGTEWTTWRGAKWIVTNRLNRLVNQQDQAKRQELRDQANECVNYLFEAAKRLRGKVERARRTLDS